MKRAYGEADGLMGRLHLNMLAHINTRLGADFDLAAFRHTVEVRRDPPRVEAYLVATQAATYRVGGQAVAFAEGERVHTDNAYKMSPETFRSLAERAGWEPARVWLDPQGLFALHLLRV